MNRYVVAIYDKRTGEHVVEEYYADTPVIAALCVIANETSVYMKDMDRTDYDLDDLCGELQDQLVSLTLTQIN